MTAPGSSERLLTSGQAAAWFGVHRRTLVRWSKLGLIASVRTVGGHRRFREGEVRALLASLAAGSGS